MVGQKVDMQRFALPPEAGCLKDGGAAEPFVGEQERVAESAPAHGYGGRQADACEAVQRPGLGEQQRSRYRREWLIKQGSL